MDRIIYLDNNATTRTDPRVLEAMLPYFSEEYGNAASIHGFGMYSSNSVRIARKQVALLIGSEESDIIFTSGATESINLALKGFALANQKRGKHIITVETEHKAVLDTCKYLESIGFEVTYLPVKKDGLVDIDNLKRELRLNTILVCVMLANNEIGVIQPVREIGKIVREAGVMFLSDATQAVGKIPVDVNNYDVDFLAFSGHKFYGPKGIGVLYVRNLKSSGKNLEAILHGGGHENGLRSGTLNVPGIIGLGKACEIAMGEMKIEAERISKLRDQLESELLKVPMSHVNGSTELRMYNVSNLCFPGTDANVLIGRLRNIAVSNGSACTAAIVEPSHVLKAIGLTDDDALASIRFSFGRFNTQDDIREASTAIQKYLAMSSSIY